jgi:hypothetical protein
VSVRSVLFPYTQKIRNIGCQIRENLYLCGVGGGGGGRYCGSIDDDITAMLRYSYFLTEKVVGRRHDPGG